MGLITRSIVKVLIFIAAAATAAWDKFFILGDAFTTGEIGFFTFIGQWLWIGVNNVYTSFWTNLTGIFTNLFARKIPTMLRQVWFVALAWGIIFIIVFFILDIYTGPEITPRGKSAIIAFILMLIIGTIASGIDFLTAKEQIMNVTKNVTNVTHLDMRWV